ncbi:unnamed protein product [Eruca vesicaria subsp. sativa]|uniref:Uncharacterized protein n=1 Tax=Eruca vesicaria subsp. sativa TaxID=29727 RepID=A0ABC8JEK8_ERUVS|nr:unnamed protein product [Eruca vesicaria subsp. sativa]
MDEEQRAEKETTTLGEEEVTTLAEEEVMTTDEEERVNVGEGEKTLGEKDAGDKHWNEERSVESDENPSLEGDDCEVIVEDRAGYKEYDPVLRSDENEFVDVEEDSTQLGERASQRSSQVQDSQASQGFGFSC